MAKKSKNLQAAVAVAFVAGYLRQGVGIQGFQADNRVDITNDRDRKSVV